MVCVVGDAKALARCNTADGARWEAPSVRTVLGVGEGLLG